MDEKGFYEVIALIWALMACSLFLMGDITFGALYLTVAAMYYMLMS